MHDDGPNLATAVVVDALRTLAIFNPGRDAAAAAGTSAGQWQCLDLASSATPVGAHLATMASLYTFNRRQPHAGLLDMYTVVPQLVATHMYGVHTHWHAVANHGNRHTVRA